MESNNEAAGLPVNKPENNDEMESVVYADLGFDGQPDSMNPGNEEATDTLLYTDNSTARNATEGLPNDEDMDDMPADELSDDELDQEIRDLTDDENAGGEPY